MTNKKLIKILDDYTSKNYVDVGTVDEYKTLPIEKRTKKVGFWPAPWYLLPRSLPIGDAYGMIQNGNSWDELRKFLNKEFKVQYFLREGYKEKGKIYWLIRRIGWKLEAMKYWIKYFFSPCRPQLLKVIPRNQYFDLPEVMREFLFACAVSLVEDEYESKIPHHSLKNAHEMEKPMLVSWNKFYVELKKCYKYIKIDRPLFQKNLEKELALVGKSPQYKKYWSMEKKLDEMDKKWMIWATSQSSHFWT